MTSNKSICSHHQHHPLSAYLLNPHLPSFLSKYPTLEDILSNSAPLPYSYENFVAYLSQNHCLETIEFTNDVAAYSERYSSGNCSKSELLGLWHRILDTYIQTDGPKELNLPCHIRTHLSSISPPLSANDKNKSSNPLILYEPPSPQNLQPALDLVKDMMKENAYYPFIASVKASVSNSNYHHCPFSSKPSTYTTSDNISQLTKTSSSSLSSSSSFSGCNWQHPTSWSILPTCHKPTNTISSHSSSDSLFPPEIQPHADLEPMTPPESPHDYALASCRKDRIQVGKTQSQSYNPGDCKKCLPLNNSSTYESCEPLTNISHEQTGPYRSHWRKMSKQLKWKRRHSEKPVSNSTVESFPSSTLGVSSGSTPGSVPSTHTQTTNIYKNNNYHLNTK